MPVRQLRAARTIGEINQRRVRTIVSGRGEARKFLTCDNSHSFLRRGGKVYNFADGRIIHVGRDNNSTSRRRTTKS